MEFKKYLLTEEKHNYFGEKIGDILTSVQELLQNEKQIGTRKLISYSKEIVGQIRKVLHTSWSSKYKKYLFVLQKCGVAIMRAIEEKDDLKEILNSVNNEISEVLKKLGVPINDLGSPEQETDGAIPLENQ